MTSFIPVRGAEDTILSMGYNEGYIYFATDTGRIYMDAQGKEKVPIGGNGVSVFYGHDSKAYVDTVDANLYFLTMSQIDNSGDCHVDDLILNSDGCFYKIILIDENSDIIQATRLSVSGSGSGGSGGGDTPYDSTSIVISEVKGVETGKIFIYGQSSNVVIRGYSSEDPKITYQFTVTTVYGDSKTERVFIRTVKNNEECVFDLGSNLTLGTTILTIQAMSDNVTKTATKKFSALSCVVMSLDESANFNPLTPFFGDVAFKCIPVGKGITKNLYVSIDGRVINSLTQKNLTSSGQERTITIPASLLPHGYHTIVAKLTNEDETVYTELSYEICCVESSMSTPIIWVNHAPSTIVNHNALNIEYMVYSPDDPVHAEVRRYLNGSELANSPITESSSEINWLNWRVVGYEVGTNTVTISCGSTSRQLTIEVTPDTERELDVIQSGLLVNLDATGRSNKENETSRMSWTSGDCSVSFNNFNWYNNGWITDDDGETCLRISNGASISIPLDIMRTAKLSQNLTFEFIFKVRNVTHYGTLINTVVTGSDENPIITKEVSSTDGVWGSYYKNKVGFCLGTQETFVKSSNTTVSGRFREDELVHVSFVLEAPNVGGDNNPLIYIYINGVNSGIGKYNIDTDNFASQCESIEINSNYCDVDLYKLRVYQGSALTASEIVRNYIADYADAELYDVNQICSYDNNVPTIDYDLMCEYNNQHPGAELLPYAVIETTDVNNTLPYVKMSGDAWKVNITFVNPSLDYLYNNGGFSLEQCKDLGYSSSDEAYIHSCPSFTATNVDINVQGTSSQGYPIRNYKLKFKGAKEWLYTDGPLKGKSLNDKNTLEDGTKVGKKWFMDSQIGANKFTWKADYMDSSGVHNTGFASFVKTLYSKHPLQDYGVSEDIADKYRTSVYGFPMLVFQKKTDGTVEFRGRYNYNLDKSCDDNYGFCDLELDDVHSWVKNPLFGQSDEDGNAYPEWLDFGGAAECWEFSNNQGGRCSFTKTDFEETDVNGRLTVLDDFEYRYHPDGDAIDDAINGLGDYSGASQAVRNTFILSKYARFEKVCKWLESTNVNAATNEALPTPVTYSEVTYDKDTAEYRLAKFGAEFEDWFDKEYCEIYYIMTELLLCYDSRGKNLMLATWGPHKEGGNDIWYPIFYDIDTQLGVNNSGVPYWDYYEEASENNTFSTSDSILWNNLWSTDANNIKARYGELRGVKLTYDTINGYYNFDPAVSKSIAMEGQRPIVITNIDEYVKYIAPSKTGYTDTTGKSGVISDAFFYCLQGTRELQRSLFLRNRLNYIDSKWQQGAYAITGAKQGIQMRYDANDYPNTSDKYLNHAPTESEIEKGFEQATYPNDLDAVLDFNVTPYLKQYMNVIYDDTVLPGVYASDGETVTIPTPANKINEIQDTPNFQQQLVYFGGAEYLSSLGDLSKKYPDQLFMSSAKRLRDLRVGSDVPGYFNKMMNSQSFKPDDSAKKEGKSNPNAKTLLQTVNLTNLTNLDGTLDFSGSEKLKEFRALNTIINSLVLADGVQIETLYLPETITTIKLTEPTSLTGITNTAASTTEQVTTYEPIGLSESEYEVSKYYVNTLEDGYILCDDVNYNPSKKYYEKVVEEQTTYPKGLYIEGITNKTTINDDDVTHLNTVNIIGGNMNYASYELVNTVMKIKEKMQAVNDLSADYNKILYLNLENIKWSPYRQVEYGENIKENASYAKKTDHYTFIDYSDTTNWKKDTLNGRIYEVDNELLETNKDKIVDASFLEALIDSYESVNNYFRSTTEYGDGRNTIPYISGDLFINNSEDAPISEDLIKNTYNSATYFPKLNIYVAHADEAYIAKYIEVFDSGVEYEWDVLKYNKATTTHPTVSAVTPSKLNYDFLGWADHEVDFQNITREEAEAEVLSDEAIAAKTFSASNDVITFYAVYSIHKHQVDFCQVNDDGTVTLIETQYIPWGTCATLPADIPWKDDSGLDIDKTYKFLGYSTDKLALEAIDLNNFPIYRDYSNAYNSGLYAIFDSTPISVYENTHPEYFSASEANVDTANYDAVTRTNYGDAQNTSYNLDGIAITLTKKVQGKLTIPATFNGKPVTAIAGTGFTANKNGGNLTRIFFAKDATTGKANIRTIGKRVFLGDTNLLSCEYPEGLRVIKAYAFQGCAALENINLVGTVYSIENYAYSGAFKTSLANTGLSFTIGGNVYTLGTNDAVFRNQLATAGKVIAITLGSDAKGVNYDAREDKKNIFDFPEIAVQSITVYTPEGVTDETIRSWFRFANSDYSFNHLTSQE